VHCPCIGRKCPSRPHGFDSNANRIGTPRPQVGSCRRFRGRCTPRCSRPHSRGFQDRGSWDHRSLHRGDR
jgi:hypothetical protein